MFASIALVVVLMCVCMCVPVRVCVCMCARVCFSQGMELGVFASIALVVVSMSVWLTGYSDYLTGLYQPLTVVTLL